MSDRTAYPVELEDHVMLANHRLLHIRPLRPCEDGPVRELYRHLSPRTRYLRFFSPMPVLPDSVVNLLTCVDYRRRLALLAEVETSSGADVVALGSFGATGDRRAEVGLVVRDEWQRQGVGLALACRVLRAAEARGFDRFVAHALWENTVIRTFLDRVGDIVSTKTWHGVSEISFVRRRAA